MKKLICFFFILLCGCGSVPFKKTEYGLMRSITPEEILRKHAVLMPLDFKIINTVVFKFRTKKFLCLGYLSVDVNNRSFELAGMNAVGIKLIEIAAKDGAVTVNNVIEEISKRGDIAKVLVEDIYRIYFDQSPLSDALLDIKEKEIVFNQDDGTGILKYVFGGRDHHLIEKTHYEGKKKIWSVSYYEYFKKNGKTYPQGIIFRNYKYKYKLIIDTKEII